jgi:hypothetical protein
MLVEVDGARAVAETYQFSFYWREPGDDPEFNRLNSNRYRDVFECRHGEWRILRRDFLRNFSFPIRPTGFPTAENKWPTCRVGCRRAAGNCHATVPCRFRHHECLPMPVTARVCAVALSFAANARHCSKQGPMAGCVDARDATVRNADRQFTDGVG